MPTMSGSLARILAFDAGKKWIIRLGLIGISRTGAGALSSVARSNTTR